MSNPNVRESDFAVPATIDVVVQRLDGVTVVAVSGELDMLTAPTLKSSLTEQVDDAPAVVVDLNGVTFLGSAGLATLVGALHQAERRAVPLFLSATSHSVLRPLIATGLSEIFPVYPSPEEAVRAINRVEPSRAGS
ncbi:MAG TPA: anti-sigma factor antagonist [Pseudonocardiaceae bacterium]|jgi:anti-anti-sigma factor|nr:anti-sigma factor antagonist [Pseudonocardiaceae bacterium]